MDKRVSLLLIIVMNACAGLGTFDLIQNGTTASKVVGFVAWLCGNVLAVLGQPLVVGKGKTALPLPDEGGGK